MLNSDTIILQNTYLFDKKPKDWEDTVVLVNLELLKESVKNFKYLIYGRQYWGYLEKTIIDSSGKISYTRIPILRYLPGSIKKVFSKQNKISEKLSAKEFERFCPSGVFTFILK